MICTDCTLQSRECKACDSQGWIISALHGKTFCTTCLGQGRVRNCETCFDTGIEPAGLPLSAVEHSSSRNFEGKWHSTEEGHLLALLDPSRSVTPGIECLCIRHPTSSKWLTIDKPSQEEPIVSLRGEGVEPDTHLYVMLKTLDHCPQSITAVPSSVIRLFRGSGGRVRNFLVTA